MAITNYATLKTAVQNWAARSDSDFTNRIDDFIDAAEDRINYGSEDRQFPSDPLRVLGLESRENLDISSATVGVPTGWLESIRLYLDINPIKTVKYLTPDRFYEADVVRVSTSGKPTIYTMEGTNFQFGPAPDLSYTGKLSFFKKIPALSGDNETNWLITNSPLTYLYGSLIEYGIWSLNDELTLKYLNLFSGRINSLMTQDKKARTSGSHLRMIADVTP